MVQLETSNHGIRELVRDYTLIENGLQRVFYDDFQKKLCSIIGRNLHLSIITHSEKSEMHIDLFDDSGYSNQKPLIIATIIIFLQTGKIVTHFYYPMRLVKTHHAIRALLEKGYHRDISRVLGQTAHFSEISQKVVLGEFTRSHGREELTIFLNDLHEHTHTFARKYRHVLEKNLTVSEPTTLAVGKEGAQGFSFSIFSTKWMSMKKDLELVKFNIDNIWDDNKVEMRMFFQMGNIDRTLLGKVSPKELSEQPSLAMFLDTLTHFFEKPIDVTIWAMEGNNITKIQERKIAAP